MSDITRRRLLAAAPAGLVGASLVTGSSQAAAGALLGSLELVTPFRLQDSRTMEPDKYDSAARDTLVVPGLAGKLGVVVNLTVTQTEGAGYFRVAGDVEDPPTTSSINWYTDGQTIANMAIVKVTPPSAGIAVQGGGAGRAHLIIDVLALIA